MSSMQIVINMSKEEYDEFNKSYLSHTDYTEYGRKLLSLFREGHTILPKGKLIAEPTEEEIAKTIGGKNDFADCIREAVKTVFANAPTIIEADRDE